MIVAADTVGVRLNIGEAIDTVRRLKGMSQRKLAADADIDAQTLNRIVRGHIKDPGYSTIRNIVRALGIDVQLLGALMQIDTSGPEFAEWMLKKILEEQGRKIEASVTTSVDTSSGGNLGRSDNDASKPPFSKE